MTHAILALLVTAALSGAAVETAPVQAAPAEGCALCCEWTDGDCIPDRDGSGRSIDYLLRSCQIEITCRYNRETTRLYVIFYRSAIFASCLSEIDEFSERKRINRNPDISSRKI